MGTVLDLLNQIKKFIHQEKGSYFSLLIYIFLGVALFEWIISFIKEDLGFEINHLYPLAGIFIIIIIFWYNTRKLHKIKTLVNIGIAQMDILNISTTKTLNAEQKMQLSTEVINYIYNRLSHIKQKLKLDKHINFLRVPPRVDVNYANNDKIARKLGIDTIIWGTIRYENNKIYINTKLAFSMQTNMTKV